MGCAEMILAIYTHKNTYILTRYISSHTQYVAADPKGRAVMIAAVEKQKLVYVFNRDAVCMIYDCHVCTCVYIMSVCTRKYIRLYGMHMCVHVHIYMHRGWNKFVRIYNHDS